MQRESNITLDILIHDYLKKCKYIETANSLKKEANIRDYNPKDCTPLLYEWFGAFNDIYNVRSGRVGCQENLARIENVMLKLENEKRRYRNMGSENDVLEKTKDVHDMSYNAHNERYDRGYSEYTTPKASKNENSLSEHEHKSERRSYSEAYDRRSSIEGKNKGVMPITNVTQYYGEEEIANTEGENPGFTTDEQRVINNNSYYVSNNVAHGGDLSPVYSNEYQRINYQPQGRMAYGHEQGRVPYQNDPDRVSFDRNLARPQYNNNLSRMPGNTDLGKPMHSTELTRMPHSPVASKGHYSEPANPYKREYRKAGDLSAKYQYDSPMHYDKNYGVDDLVIDNPTSFAERYTKEPYKSYDCLAKMTSFQLHKQRINALCVSNNNNIFITGGLDQTINIVDILSFRITKIDLNVKIISDIKLNEQTNEILVAADTKIYIYSLDDLSVTSVLREHTCTIRNICIDGEFMFTTDVEGILKKWKNHELVCSIDLHATRSEIFNGTLIVSDRNRVFTYDHKSLSIVKVLFDECAFIKVYDMRLMLFFKTKVVILDENFENVNSITCNEKIQSGCILSDNGVLLGFYQGMAKHINNEMSTVNSEGNVTVLEKYVKDNEIVIGGCYDGSVVLWEHH